MLVFLVATVGFVALMLVFSLPAILVARQDRRRHRGVDQKFAAAAVGVGVLCGVLVGISRRLVDQCTAQGNTQCHDAGGTGLVALIAIGFLAVSTVRAYLMFND